MESDTPNFWEQNGLVGWVEQKTGYAEYRLHFQVAPATGARHHAGSEIATFRLDDPDLGSKIRNVAQAFRMGKMAQ